MDRLTRPFVACGLVLILAATGCRATRPEVPPGRPFAKDGQQRKAIEFSSDGHPVNGAASANFMPSNLGGSNMASGIGAGLGRPDGGSLGGPPGAYGPPGTAGMPGSSDPSTSRASTAPAEMPAPAMPPLESPPAPSQGPAPSLDPMPSREEPQAPNQIIPPAMDKPGVMGSPNQMPSPN